jgi:hypothetical protein
MSSQFSWNEEEQAMLEKTRSEFLVWKDESSKWMEELMKRIKSFSPPRTSPTSQAPPIQPTPPATRSDRMMPKPQAVLETQTRNKKAELAGTAKSRFSVKDYSDHMALVHANEGWKDAERKGSAY